MSQMPGRKITGAVGLVLLCGFLFADVERRTNFKEKDTMSNNESNLLWVKQGGSIRIASSAIGLGNVVRLESEVIASISAWPADRPQKHRNDFVARHSVKAGDDVPIGGELFHIYGVYDDENMDSIPESLGIKSIGHGILVIDSKPITKPGVTLHRGSFCMTAGNTGELHGKEIQVAELMTKEIDGKTSAIARLEIWPNDYNKQDAAKQDLVTAVEVSAGKTVQLGDWKHTVLSIQLPQAGSIGWIELNPEK
jgi:hypothetical protein